ncbi:hypothetical protein FQA39_LY11201 [Lamprigera yunnana]|nr:hypothetical protein FQA39_LY11201 [Lamprigera yunnana]
MLETVEIPVKKYEKVTWNDNEIILRAKKKIIENYEVPISAALEVKFKRSVFGTFLDSFNSQQTQTRLLNLNKLSIVNWEIGNLILKKENTSKRGMVTILDEQLKKFEHLKIINLAGNWIHEICGHFLPKDLAILECYGNVVADLTSFLVNAPYCIVYIGFGRNTLSDGKYYVLLFVLIRE